MSRIILHADINNFYASVAICNNPSLRNKPVVICGDAEKRHGVVLAKSNVAKKAGIKTGDTIFEAKKKLSSIIIVPPDYKQYMQFSNKIYNIYKDFTPLVESFGLDECWLDVTGVQKIFGDGEQIAHAIKERVKKEVGLTISVGVSFTKIFAKLGSDIKKPDAVTVINKDNYKKIAWSLPADNMLMVGKSVKNKLQKMNVRTIGELANTPEHILQATFGKVGQKLYEYANGLDTDEVQEYNVVHLPESVSNGTTTENDIVKYADAMALIYSLSEVIAYRLRNYNLEANGVSLSLRNSALESFTRQKKLLVSTSDAQIIAEQALYLLQENYDFSKNLPLRSITVGTYDLEYSSGDKQLTIFDNKLQKNINIDKKLDKLREKYGYTVLKRAISMNDAFSCDAKEIDDGFLPFDKSKNTIEE